MAFMDFEMVVTKSSAYRMERVLTCGPGNTLSFELRLARYAGNSQICLIVT